MHLKEIKGKQSPHKSFCPFPFNNKEVIIGLRYLGCHLPLIPSSQGHLSHSRPLLGPRAKALTNERLSIGEGKSAVP